MRAALRLVCWLVLVVVTLEVCARIDDAVTSGAPLVGTYDNSILNSHDALGERGKPYARYRKWKLNSLGFRGPEIDWTVPRVLCLGSSETFGQSERENGEWPRRLEARLNADGGQRVHVVNGGFAGETLYTTVKRLPETLRLTQPIAVVAYPSLANYLWVPYLKEGGAKPPPPRRFELRIAGRLRTVLKATLPERVQTALRQREIEREAKEYPVIWSSMPRHLLEQFRRDLEQIAAVTRGAGAQLFLITHANRFSGRVEPAEQFMLTSWRKFYPMLTEKGLLVMEEQMNDVMREVARELSIPLIDGAREMPTGPEFFSDFVHFTDRGAAAFSTIVASSVEEHLDALTRGRPRSVLDSSVRAQ